MKTRVDFETAKLLKEKGFDERCTHHLFNNKSVVNFGSRRTSKEILEGLDKGTILLALPTIAEVVMWLYEKHGVWIEVHGWTNQPVGEELWKNCFQAFVNGDAMNVSIFKTPTKAYQEAISYTLKNLLK